MSFLDNILLNLPEVQPPKQKKLPFNERLKWTLIVLVLFFVMGMVPLWPVGQNTFQQFQYLSIILGAEFGSLISLGIGPIVTGSIILQLLNGAGIFKFDLTTHEGKQKFEGIQKLVSILFIVFEALIYVFMGGIGLPSSLMSSSARMQYELLLVLELFFGGLIILFMDEIVSKWGFGSGISLFIAAGISKQIFLQLFSFTDSNGTLFYEPGFQSQLIVGNIWKILIFLIGPEPDFTVVLASVVTILVTLLVFAIAVYAQAMKVEIPLSFGRVRGHGIRWPLQFIYTSNIPVILVASLFATIQLWMRLFQKVVGSDKAICWLFANTDFCFPGGFNQGQPFGFISALNGPDLARVLIQHQWSILGPTLFYSVLYVILMIGGSVLFSIFWVQTSGMDSRSLADQIMSSGLQIPGFRKDRRILERLLDRYIMPLTVMGALVVGFLAAVADLMGALARGTGILLTVMIVYKLYEDIAREHLYDMNPMIRKFMGK
jgi:preprotein translocase subunit SecY